MTAAPGSGPSSGTGLALEAVHNVRDLGGTRTRAGGRLLPRRLLRGASVSSATAGDVGVLHDAGVGVVVDLRADWERAEAGVVPADFVVHELPLVEDHQRAESHDVLRADGLVGYSAWLVAQSGARLLNFS